MSEDSSVELLLLTSLASTEASVVFVSVASGVLQPAKPSVNASIAASTIFFIFIPFVLVFVIFYLTEPKIVVSNDPNALIGLGAIGAFPVAILVWSIGLSLGGTTGYAINPARDLGPRIVHSLLPVKGSSDWSYAWIPVVGPIIGAAIAAGLFLILQ